MAHYYCDLKLTEKSQFTEDEARKKLLEELNSRELIDEVFDEDLEAEGDIDEVSLCDDFIAISEKLPDVLIWVDAYVDTSSIYRQYCLNGETQFVDSIINFPDAVNDKWQKTV